MRRTDSSTCRRYTVAANSSGRLGVMASCSAARRWVGISRSRSAVARGDMSRASRTATSIGSTVITSASWCTVSRDSTAGICCDAMMPRRSDLSVRMRADHHARHLSRAEFVHDRAELDYGHGKQHVGGLVRARRHDLRYDVVRRQHESKPPRCADAAWSPAPSNSRTGRNCRLLALTPFGRSLGLWPVVRRAEKRAESTYQPYVSRGPRPRTRLGPLTQDGATGPCTWMRVTRSRPTSAVIRVSSRPVRSRSWVAHAVDSASMVSSPFSSFTGRQWLARSGPTSRVPACRRSGPRRPAVASRASSPASPGGPRMAAGRADLGQDRSSRAAAAHCR